MKNYFSLYFIKFSIVFIITIFATPIVGQVAQGNIADNDLCGCNSIIKHDNTIKYEGKDEIGLHPNGKIKYKLTKKGKKEQRTFYYPTGTKCKEEFFNYRINIKKTIFYDPFEKKQMVCKGTLKTQQ